MDQPTTTLPPMQQLEHSGRVSPVSHQHPYATPSPALATPQSQPPSLNGHLSQSHPSPHSDPPRPHFLPHQSYPGSDPARHTSYSHDGIDGTNGNSGLPKASYPPLQPHPGPDARTPKREIKRRTKTGCLTCRRRRIKCDEGQPTCGNCRKSKRECLGYDPIFKASMIHSIVPTSVTFPQSLPSPIHQLQQVTRPPPSENHQAFHLPLPNSHIAQSRTPPPTQLSQPNHSVPFDSPLDPALNSSTPVPSPPAAPQFSAAHDANIPDLNSFRRSKHVFMDDLYAADSSLPSVFASLPPAPSFHSPTDTAEVMSIWRSQYSGMLDSFFETQWYSQEGSIWLGTIPDKMNYFLSCNSLFKTRPPPGSAEAIAIPFLEARLVWILAEVPRCAWATKRKADAQLADLLHRLDVVEHLLTGAVLPPALIPPAPAVPPTFSGREVAPTPEYVSHNFWHHLGCFCAADDTLPPASQHQQHQQQQLADSLLHMRQILSVLENRDVLYSIAIARHYGGRLQRLDLEKLPSAQITSDPEHPFNKLSVAFRFLADEEVGGTTAVVRGLAALAQRGVVRSHVSEADQGIMT